MKRPVYSGVQYITYHLSPTPFRRCMEFFNPAGGLLALLALPIILFYILKVRLRRETVSTTLFWDRLFQERRTRAFWRRLRYWISLFLSLLFLGLLTAGLLHPVFVSQKRAARLVLIFDNSASQNAVDSGGKTRFEAAKKRLKTFLDGLESDRQTAILTSGGSPRVAVGFTTHGGTLRRTVDAITPTDLPSFNDDAVQLARKILGQGNRSIEKEIELPNEKREKSLGEIYVFSDETRSGVRKGDWGDTPEKENDAPIESVTKTEKTPFADSPDNVAITRFQPRRTFGDTVGYEILVEVASFGPEPLECRLEIERDGIPLDVIPLTLAPRVPQTRIVSNLGEQGGLLQARLDHSDIFATDNTAIAFLPAREKRNILFYGKEDFFLLQVLRSQPNVELRVVAECPWEVPADTVLVIHQTVPPTIPRGNVFVVDPRNDSDAWKLGENLESPIVAKMEADHPLMKFVHLNNVLLPGAKRLVLQPESQESTEGNTWTVLAETPEGYPLIARSENRSRKTLVLSTELIRGDLALRTAFPIMVSNALLDFEGAGGEWERAYTTADSITLEVPGEWSDVVLKSPEGIERRLPVRGGRLALGTLPKCGLWEIRNANEKNEKNEEQAGSPSVAKTTPIRIACNLCNEKESDLRYTHSDENAAPVRVAGMSRPFWFIMILFALLLSVFEWISYQRRWID